MSATEQNITIAKWCGWTLCFEKGPWRSPNGTHHDVLPDFTNDLNAIHEAEAKLHGREQLEAWNDNFYHVEYPPNINSDDIQDWPMHASAKQRAEALLKTIGFWVDEQKAL